MEGAVFSVADKRKIQIESVKEMNSIAPSSVRIVENIPMSTDLNNWYASNDVSDTKGISQIFRRYGVKGALTYQLNVPYVPNVAEIIRERSSFFNYKGKDNVAMGVKLSGTYIYMILVYY